MQIDRDDPTRPDCQALLREHLDEMRALSPPESVHALDLRGLLQPSITFWTARRDGQLLACGALHELDPAHGELKSMRTPAALRRQGAGRGMLAHLIAEARRRGYRRLSLETGATEGFLAAQTLYLGAGFAPCPPFGAYRPDPHSLCMTMTLDPEAVG